jgi:hypothetical protein
LAASLRSNNCEQETARTIKSTTFTGKQATLEGDGWSFEAIKRERVAAGAPS